MIGQHVINSQAERRGRTRFCLTFLRVLLLAAFTLPLVAAAQDAPAEGTPLLPDTGSSAVRSDLLRLLQQVNGQLKDATTAGDQEEIDRLIDLKSQLQVLQLQVELETLQRENESLREQSAPTDGSPAADDPAASTSPALSGIEQKFAVLSETQASTREQLNTIAERHAELLEQLGQDMPDMPGMAEPSAAPAAAEELTSAQQREVSVLNGRFQKLTDQQRTIDRVLATVSAAHAGLLAELGASAPAQAPGSYSVQAGDSLSRIAKAVYGSGDRWPEILQANPRLTDPNTLSVGTVLTIP